MEHAFLPFLNHNHLWGLLSCPFLSFRACFPVPFSALGVVFPSLWASFSVPFRSVLGLVFLSLSQFRGLFSVSLLKRFFFLSFFFLKTRRLAYTFEMDANEADRFSIDRSHVAIKFLIISVTSVAARKPEHSCG